MLHDLAISELAARGLSIRRGGSPGEVWICCPFCILRGKGADDHGYHLGVNTRDGRGHCFRCEWRSRRALAELGLVDFQSSLEPPAKKVKTTVHLPKDFALLTPESVADDFWMKTAWNYVSNRGMSQSQIHKHRVGFCWARPQAYRVVFPIRNPEGRLVGFTGRTVLKNRNPSWLHSTGLEGMFLTQFGTNPVVTLVEGIFDALAIERRLRSETDIVAILGSHVRVPGWLERYQTIVLWLDPDTAGRKAMVEMAESFPWRPKVLIVKSRLEPADCTGDELEAAWASRREWSWNEGLKVLVGNRYDDL